jgi:hypothetical protein
VVVVPLASDGIDPRMWDEAMDRLASRFQEGGSVSCGMVITAKRQTLKERVELFGRGPTRGLRLLPGRQRREPEPRIIEEPSTDWVSIHVPLDTYSGRITIGVDQGSRHRWRHVTAVAVAISGLVFGAAVTAAFEAWSGGAGQRPLASPGVLGGGQPDRPAPPSVEESARPPSGLERRSRPVTAPLASAKPQDSALVSKAKARRLWRLRRLWRWRRLKARRHLRLARRALSTGRVKLATKHAAKAVQLDPRNKLARRILAEARRRLKLSRVLRDLWLPALSTRSSNG